MGQTEYKKNLSTFAASMNSKAALRLLELDKSRTTTSDQRPIETCFTCAKVLSRKWQKNTLCLFLKRTKLAERSSLSLLSERPITRDTPSALHDAAQVSKSPASSPTSQTSRKTQLNTNQTVYHLKEVLPRKRTRLADLWQLLWCRRQVVMRCW